MTPIYIGIDPGASGCLAAIRPRTDGPPEVFYADYKSRSPSDLYLWMLDKIQRGKIYGVLIEEVHAIYGSSAKSTFNFGFNVGVVHTIAGVLDLPTMTIQPKEWQKALGIGKVDKTERKKLIAKKILELYPDEKEHLYTQRGKLLDGRSDALAIAHYLRTQHS